MDYKIEKLVKTDWKEVAEIYRQGINTLKATFQSEVPTWESWDSNHIGVCRLVIRCGNKVLGWGALSPTSSRCVYKGVAEVSIYIGEDYKGEGLGTALLTEIIKLSEENGFWTLQSGIIKENEASIALHTKCGFRVVGIRERVAKMDSGIWHDVIFMERRSKVVEV